MNPVQKLKFVLSNNFYTESVAGDGLNAVTRCKPIKDAWGGKNGFLSKVADCIRKIKDVIDRAVNDGTIPQGSTTITHTFRLDNYLKVGSDFPSCTDVAKGDPNAGAPVENPPNMGGGADATIKQLKYLAESADETSPSSIRTREKNKLKCELLLAALGKEREQALKVLDALFRLECPKKSDLGGAFKDIKTSDGQQQAKDKINKYYNGLRDSISGPGRDSSSLPRHYAGTFCRDSKSRNAPNQGGGGDRRPDRHGGFR
jgi:hypothetical protein